MKRQNRFRLIMAALVAVILLSLWRVATELPTRSIPELKAFYEQMAKENK